MKSTSPTRNRTECIQDSNKMPSLAPHLETFAKAVADGHPAVEAAVIAGRSRGSASYMKQRAGVAERIAEFQRIKQIANERAVAENTSRVIPIVTLTRNHIINGLHHEATTAKSSCARVNAWRGLADIFMLRAKNTKEVSEFYAWTEDELQNYAKTGILPERLRRLIDGCEAPSLPGSGRSRISKEQGK